MPAAPTEFFEWFASRDPGWRERPWLVLGKGPSFSLLSDWDTSGFNTFGLNHVVRETHVDIAHAIDLDVVEHCADVLLERARYLLMPWLPHVNNRPGTRSLAQCVDAIPVLAEFAMQGRLLWYNKAGSQLHGDSPPVPVRYFSAEAPYALLGMAGVKTIRSLGIDGGNAYAPGFDKSTLLANKRSSFDRQFDEIARSITTYALDAGPLNVQGPVRVYVAATEEQALSVKVLEYSIRKHASMTTEVFPLYKAEVEIPQPRDPRNRPRTPFSFQRFLIPQVAGYAGRAIYLDSDMQVLADIRELWTQDMGGRQLLSVAPSPHGGREPQYSVMLLDCGRLHWKIEDIVQRLDEGKFDYKGLMSRMVVANEQAPSIPPEWNSLEKYVAGTTKLVHYTDMNTQPWVYALHPFGYLWVRDLIEAVEKGFVRIEEVQDHVRKGWVRPSLAYQVEHGIAEPMLLPRRILAMDRHFSAPYRKLGGHSVGPLVGARRYLGAAFRQACQSLKHVAFLRRLRHRLPW